mmetsp:Transcript_62705/g.130342  ORF Transcript_62705/g.130342 Transcript_62705/m.130342 type:complete len:210 (-) Transcript_62705:649-1278(-)
MGCIKSPWELAFGRGNNSKAWSVTGMQPFTRRVMWDLKEKEAARSQALTQSRDANPALNWDAFNPMTAFGPAQAAVPELELEGEDGTVGADLADEDREALLTTRINLSAFWNLPGGVTGVQATKIIFEHRLKKLQEAEATAAKKKEREEKEAQRRFAAAPSVERVKEFVRERGWVTEGRGTLTKGLLGDVLRVFTQKIKQGESAEDMVA